jgi:ribosomal protein L7/L12
VEKAEKTPAALKQGLTKEEAEAIMEQIKAIGGECKIE